MLVNTLTKQMRPYSSLKCVVKSSEWNRLESLWEEKSSRFPFNFNVL